MKLPSIPEIRKLLVYVVGVVAEAVSLGLLHGTALAVASGVVVVATGVGLYKVPNAEPASGSNPAG